MFIVGTAILLALGTSNTARPSAAGDTSTPVTLHHRGLHGYIGFRASQPEDPADYGAGMSFYSAVWPLIDRPLSRFQIGLAGTWILPDNRDNKDTPLAPEGTRARNWAPRGPTFASVFQTLEGGLGYWAGNHFRYHSPKFSMNGTPQCYDYEIGSPGWSFFYHDEALPDDQLGIAQLSNRLLIPPDGLPFAGRPRGAFLGYAYLALPFTEPVAADPATGEPPTGDQSWTLFLNAANFKGPAAYYLPETWSKIAKLFNYPFLYGRCLDTRPGLSRGGAMEINTVPCFASQDAQGIAYSRIPPLFFPADETGKAVLIADVTYYAKSALYDAFGAWRDGGPPCDGRVDERGAWHATLTTRNPGYDQSGEPIRGIDRVFETRVFADGTWGLQWHDGAVSERGRFPEYFRREADHWVPVRTADVPAETRLTEQDFALAPPRAPYTHGETPAWTTPGPVAGPYHVTLVDGSRVTYHWYRFVDQPSFQQYHWPEARKARLQALVEKIHARWPIDRDYLAPPSTGTLVSLDPGLLVRPPAGLERGYVPIVTGQEAAGPSSH